MGGRKRRPFDVFGLGQCSLDYLGRIGDFPPADSKCEFSDLTVEGGGPVATALVALARWGASCTFTGVVGDDHFGRLITASLAGEGVGLGGLLVRRKSSSQFAFVAAERGGRRTIFWQRPTGRPPAAAEVDLSLLRSARVFHTDGLFHEASVAACRAARAAGVPVVVDGGSLREGTLELAAESDYFLASESLSASLVGGDDPREACRRLAELGPSLAGVTLGARGYIAYDGSRFIEKPAWPAEAVDTTGCGDVFHGGFIYGLLANRGVEESLDFAAWAAASVSTKLGGRAGIPPAGEYVSCGPTR